ncbi:hypothetical protein BCR34DRAFT_596847 [Clohesyomyces aquaticus]|uniref:Zn(2)-C6 fungal-type domain-containing protein n=1 Tax=Clohesyomyces aquaticus TaxID=1231657 RepID=A0A1Y2A586_9PLEO|nr:hypothetical protein BCR34DRAFT_596847 [Clohesyomyces aquaticus]
MSRDEEGSEEPQDEDDAQFRPDTPDIVRNWLKGLSLEPNLAEEGFRGPFDDSPARSRKDSLSSQPKTPEQKGRAFEQEDDHLSPTDTSFSGRLLFDPPEVADSGWQRKQDHGRASLASSVTTLEDLEPNLYCDKQIKLPIVTEEPIADDEVISLNSYDPPSETSLSQSLATSAVQDLTPYIVDPSKPRLVWVISCLQCTIGGLPCSRQLPSCSRCVRAGCGQVCLLHRRKVFEEMTPGNVAENTTPVLLKIKGEDDKMWEEKLAWFRELYETWCREEEKRNWVLPENDGRLGSFRAYCNSVHRPRRHLGEGFGPKTPLVLHLA